MIPPFLQTNIRGDLAPGLVFHLFLTFLHEQAPLPVQQMEPDRIQGALSRTFEVLPGLVKGDGDNIALSLLLSNCAHIFGGAYGCSLYYRVINGLEERVGDGSRIEKYDWARSVLMSNLRPEGEEDLWQELPEDNLLICDDSVDLRLLKLG